MIFLSEKNANIRQNKSDTDVMVSLCHIRAAGHKVEDFSDIVMNTLCLCVFVSVPVFRFPLFIEKIIFVEVFTLKTQRL